MIKYFFLNVDDMLLTSSKCMSMYHFLINGRQKFSLLPCAVKLKAHGRCPLSTSSMTQRNVRFGYYEIWEAFTSNIFLDRGQNPHLSSFSCLLFLPCTSPLSLFSSTLLLPSPSVLYFLSSLYYLSFHN